MMKRLTSVGWNRCELTDLMEDSGQIFQNSPWLGDLLSRLAVWAPCGVVGAGESRVWAWKPAWASWCRASRGKRPCAGPQSPGFTGAQLFAACGFGAGSCPFPVFQFSQVSGSCVPSIPSGSGLTKVSFLATEASISLHFESIHCPLGTHPHSHISWHHLPIGGPP